MKSHSSPALDATPTTLYAPTQSVSSIQGYNNRGRRTSFRGRGRTNSSSSSFVLPSKTVGMVVYQICNRPRHTVLNCYHRMDHAHERRVPTKQLSAMIAAGPPTNIDASTWVTYTGASNYITNDLANLMILDSYRGADKVTVGNGASLLISHIGSSTFLHNSSAFKFSNILHCPDISTNLLYIHQFTRDNNCFFVFFYDFFYSKDLKTGKTLFRGLSNDGLYSINIHYKISTAKSHPFAFLGARIAAQVWHSCGATIPRVWRRHCDVYT